MELKDVLETLDAESREVITAAIEAEKTRGIEESRKKGSEVKKLLTEYNRLKDTLRDLEIDPDGSLEDQISSLKSKSGTGGGEVEREIKTLKKQIETLTSAVAEKERLAAEKTEKYQRSRLTETLQKELGEKIYGAEYVIKSLIADGRVKLGDDEETVYFVDNDAEVDFRKGVDSFLKSRPDIVKNNQAPGSGSKPQNKGASDQKSVSTLDMLRMT